MNITNNILNIIQTLITYGREKIIPLSIAGGQIEQNGMQVGLRANGMLTVTNSTVVLESGEEGGNGVLEFYFGVPLKIRRLHNIGNRNDWVAIYMLEEMITDRPLSRIAWDWLVNGQCQLEIIQPSSDMALISKRRHDYCNGSENGEHVDSGRLSPAIRVALMMFSGGSWLNNGDLVYQRIVEIKNPLEFVVVDEPNINGTEGRTIVVSFKFICQEAIPKNGVIFTLVTTDGIRISQHRIYHTPRAPAVIGSISMPLPRAACNFEVRCLLFKDDSAPMLYRSQPIYVPDPHPWRCCLLEECNSSSLSASSNTPTCCNAANGTRRPHALGGSRLLNVVPNQPFTVRVPDREEGQGPMDKGVIHPSDTVFIIPLMSVSATTPEKVDGNLSDNIDASLGPFKFNSKLRESIDKSLVSSLGSKTFKLEAGIYHVYLGLMHEEWFLPKDPSMLVVTSLLMDPSLVSDKCRGGPDSPSSAAATTENVFSPSYYNAMENGQQPRVPNCSICLDQNVSILIEPCRHLCLCEGCKGRIMEQQLAGVRQMCPICRGPIRKTSKIFF